MKAPRVPVCTKGSEGTLCHTEVPVTVQGPAFLSPSFAQSLTMITLTPSQLFCGLTGFSRFFELTINVPGSKTVQTFME